ncbi:hypothetical protein J6524_04800 [Bradyrhizobium sp. WSM 1738]|uniref:phage adaptor protein n=1 Tax=Bradyrhizobium hereditatis TaxID=2821405 RepID=UPI001CE35BF6|nr:hypothetical protein [Bradyrhizobium hereditatis]MCA6114248.1 hypothetical protein [Bradyrhizobium hereditatis]
MAKTFLDLRNRIAADLTRDDLADEIKSAVGDAVDHYETLRLYFNVTRSKTFSTVIGQVAYGAAALAEIPDIISLDTLFLFDGTRPLELDKYEVDEFEWLQGSMTGAGRPVAYCYTDSQILLWPVPVAVYTMRPHMHFKLPALVNDTDSNAWTNDAEQLIRCHAKLLLYTNVIEDTEGMQRMQVQIQPLADRLAYKTSGRAATGRIRGTCW